MFFFLGSRANMKLPKGYKINAGWNNKCEHKQMLHWH